MGERPSEVKNSSDTRNMCVAFQPWPAGRETGQEVDIWSHALSSGLVISSQDSFQPRKGIYGSVASLPKGRVLLTTADHSATVDRDPGSLLTVAGEERGPMPIT